MARTSAGRRLSPVPRGIGLHIGLNSVDPAHYQGWSGPLTACEADARDMAGTARAHRVQSTMLLTRDATRAAVLAGIRAAQKSLKSGDFFFLTYSGHGGQVEDVTGEEGDKLDETWCLFDGQLIDDELYLEFGRFRSGVRILMLSDSCHSGTVARVALVGGPAAGGRPKFLPADVAQRTYKAHRAFYDGLQRKVAAAAGSGPEPSDGAGASLPVSRRLRRIAGKFAPRLILISGCQDNQTSMDGPANGAFTGALLEVWGNGTFTGDYRRFHKEIVAKLPPSQTPNLFTLGTASAFLSQRPFTVGPGGGARRVTALSARSFVAAAKLPAARKRAMVLGVAPRAEPMDPFQTGIDQATVVGSSVISFVRGVTAERREAIVNSSLLAQLHASRVVPEASKVFKWYDAYLDVLTNIGWVIQDRGFAEYKETKANFEAHEAVLAVATTLLGPGATALAVVKSTLDALKKMQDNSPWLTIFNKESRQVKTARFQIGLAEEAPDGQFFVNLMAFGMVAKSKLTQVLFFKAKKTEVTLRHHSGKITINTAVVDAIRKELAERLQAHAGDYIRTLPPL